MSGPTRQPDNRTTGQESIPIANRQRPVVRAHVHDLRTRTKFEPPGTIVAPVVVIIIAAGRRPLRADRAVAAFGVTGDRAMALRLDDDARAEPARQGDRRRAVLRG